MIVLVLATGLALVAGMGLARLTKPQGGAATIAAVFTLTIAVVITCSVVLSLFDAYTRGAVLATLGALALVCAPPAWLQLRALSRRPLTHGLARLRRDALLAVLAALVCAELLYSLALALFTPQTDYDALSYHLVRAVLWIQQSSVSPIGGMDDSRIDEFPPNAEILQGFTMLASHAVRFVGLVQLAALAVTIVACYGIGRRLGLRGSRAAFGALLYPTLPVVALQAPSALNDIVVAAFIALAVFFALGRSNGDAVNLVVSAGVLAGVKVTAILALPLVLGIPALVHRGRRRLVLLAGVGAAWLAGSWWYAFNVSSGEGVLGEDASHAGATDGPLRIAARLSRIAIQTLELPGAAGRDRYLYLVGAGALLVAAAAQRDRARRGRLAGAAALTALTLVVLPVESVLRKAHYKVFDALGEPTLAGLDIMRGQTTASTLWSWYGPVGLAFAVIGVVLAWMAVRRRTLPVVGLVLSAAPLYWVVAIAVSVAYHPFNGRYAMGGVALAASTWGLVRERAPAISMTAVVVTGITLVLALSNSSEKPLGIRLLEDTHRGSIWTLPRAWAQNIKPELARVTEYTDAHVPSGSLVAVSSAPDTFAFLYVGHPRLDRRIVIVRSLDDAAHREADWAVIELPTPTCRAGWTLRLSSPPLGVFRRSPGTSCAPG